MLFHLGNFTVGSENSARPVLIISETIGNASLIQIAQLLGNDPTAGLQYPVELCNILVRDHASHNVETVIWERDFLAHPVDQLHVRDLRLLDVLLSFSSHLGVGLKAI